MPGTHIWRQHCAERHPLMWVVVDQTFQPQIFKIFQSSYVLLCGWCQGLSDAIFSLTGLTSFKYKGGADVLISSLNTGGNTQRRDSLFSDQGGLSFFL